MKKSVLVLLALTLSSIALAQSPRSLHITGGHISERFTAQYANYEAGSATITLVCLAGSGHYEPEAGEVRVKDGAEVLVSTDVSYKECMAIRSALEQSAEHDTEIVISNNSISDIIVH